MINNSLTVLEVSSLIRKRKVSLYLLPFREVVVDLNTFFCLSHRSSSVTSSSVHHQVSLVAREKEETQVSQALLEWREPQDWPAPLDHQGQGDPPEDQDQELERESQEYQEGRVGLSYCLSVYQFMFLFLLTETTTFWMSLSFHRWDRFPRTDGFPWTARSSWKPRVSWTKRTGWRTRKRRTLRWSRIPRTER